MKRILAACLVGVLMLVPTLSTAASIQTERSFSSATVSTDFSALSALTPDIVYQVNQALRKQYGDNASQVTDQDVDWNRAYKIYIDANIYDACEDSTEQILAYLDLQEYIWEIPLTVGKTNIAVDLSIKMPLTEEAKQILTEQEQQEARDRTGKWGISSVEVDRKIGSFTDQFQKLLDENKIDVGNTTCILLGGMETMRSVVGICLNEETVEKIFPLEAPRMIGTLNNKTRSAVPKGIQQNQGYSFEQMAQTLNNLTPPSPYLDDGVGGGTETQPFSVTPVILFALCCIAVAAAVLFVKKRNSNNL